MLLFNLSKFQNLQPFWHVYKTKNTLTLRSTINFWPNPFLSSRIHLSALIGTYHSCLRAGGRCVPDPHILGLWKPCLSMVEAHYKLHKHVYVCSCPHEVAALHHIALVAALANACKEMAWKVPFSCMNFMFTHASKPNMGLGNDRFIISYFQD